MNATPYDELAWDRALEVFIRGQRRHLSQLYKRRVSREEAIEITEQALRDAEAKREAKAQARRLSDKKGQGDLFLEMEMRRK